MATAGTAGAVTVAVAGGKTVIVLGTPPFACAQPTGRLAGATLGPMHLGMTRAAVRRQFSKRVHAWAPVHGLLLPGADRDPRRLPVAQVARRDLSRAQRTRVRGRAVLALTDNRHFAMRGVRPDTRLTAAVRRKLHTGTPYHVGLNFWYLVTLKGSRGVLKVRHGTIQEIGIADARLTSTRPAARRFLRTFY